MYRVYPLHTFLALSLSLSECVWGGGGLAGSGAYFLHVICVSLPTPPGWVIGCIASTVYLPPRPAPPRPIYLYISFNRYTGRQTLLSTDGRGRKGTRAIDVCVWLTGRPAVLLFHTYVCGLSVQLAGWGRTDGMDGHVGGQPRPERSLYLSPYQYVIDVYWLPGYVCIFGLR